MIKSLSPLAPQMKSRLARQTTVFFVLQSHAGRFATRIFLSIPNGETLLSALHPSYHHRPRQPLGVLLGWSLLTMSIILVVSMYFPVTQWSRVMLSSTKQSAKQMVSILPRSTVGSLFLNIETKLFLQSATLPFRPFCPSVLPTFNMSSLSKIK